MYFFYLLAFIVGVGGFLIIEIAEPVEPLPVGVFYLYGVPIASFVPSTLLVLVGVAWVIHGFGFYIIR